MKMMFAGKMMSNPLALLLLVSTSVVRGFFVGSPASLSVRSHVREMPVAAPGATGADPKEDKTSKEKKGIQVDMDQITGQFEKTRDQMRDFIWSATDYVAHAVDDMPDIGMSNTTQGLARLGTILEDFDDKYFSKYLSAGSTPRFQDTLAASASSATGQGGAGTAASAAKGDKKKDKAASSAVLESAGAPKGVSFAGDAVSEVGNDVIAEVKTVVSKNLSGSASGTVQLDRPKQVQGVFDDIQAAAVNYYKTSPTTATSKGGAAAGGAGVATPLPEAVQVLEAKLEGFLTESRFRPRKLQKEKKSGLVETIRAMEKSYPTDANPLGDPALSGQWSVVYSSSSKLIGRALRGVLAGFFKTSDARQVVDAGASSVLNACRARLRMTPLALRLASKGSYRATGARKVMVDMPPAKKGLLRRLLPSLRPAKVEAEVTYLSGKWRICRADGVTVAFRKSGD